MDIGSTLKLPMTLCLRSVNSQLKGSNPACDSFCMMGWLAIFCDCFHRLRDACMVVACMDAVTIIINAFDT